MSLESTLNNTITNAVASQNTVSISPEQIRTLVSVASPVIRDNQRLLNGTDEQRRQLGTLISQALMRNGASRDILRNAARTYVRSLPSNAENNTIKTLFAIAPWSEIDSRITTEMAPHMADALNGNRRAISEALQGPGPNDPTRNYPTPRQLREIERGLQNNAMATPEERNLGQFEAPALTAALARSAVTQLG